MDHRGRGERRRKIRRVSKTGGPRYGQEMCWHFAKAVLLAATGQVRWYRRFFDLSLKKFKGRFFVCSLSFHRNAFPQKERAPHRTKGRAVAFSAIHMLTTIICVWEWSSPFYLILLYLMFCITSEITLSPTDLAGMWRGIFILVIFIILLNLIPGVNWVAIKASELLAPVLFAVHSALFFVLLIDVLFYIIFKLIRII